MILEYPIFLKEPSQLSVLNFCNLFRKLLFLKQGDFFEQRKNLSNYDKLIPIQNLMEIADKQTYAALRRNYFNWMRLIDCGKFPDLSDIFLQQLKGILKNFIQDLLVPIERAIPDS